MFLKNTNNSQSLKKEQGNYSPLTTLDQDDDQITHNNTLNTTKSNKNSVNSNVTTSSPSINTSSSIKNTNTSNSGENTADNIKRSPTHKNTTKIKNLIGDDVGVGDGVGVGVGVDVGVDVGVGVDSGYNSDNEEGNDDKHPHTLKPLSSDSEADEYIEKVGVSGVLGTRQKENIIRTQTLNSLMGYKEGNDVLNGDFNNRGDMNENTIFNDVLKDTGNNEIGIGSLNDDNDHLDWMYATNNVYNTKNEFEDEKYDGIDIHRDEKHDQDRKNDQNTEKQKNQKNQKKKTFNSKNKPERHVRFQMPQKEVDTEISSISTNNLTLGEFDIIELGVLPELDANDGVGVGDRRYPYSHPLSPSFSTGSTFYQSQTHQALTSAMLGEGYDLFIDENDRDNYSLQNRKYLQNQGICGNGLYIAKKSITGAFRQAGKGIKWVVKHTFPTDIFGAMQYRAW